MKLFGRKKKDKSNKEEVKEEEPPVQLHPVEPEAAKELPPKTGEPSVEPPQEEAGKPLELPKQQANVPPASAESEAQAQAPAPATDESTPQVPSSEPPPKPPVRPCPAMKGGDEFLNQNPIPPLISEKQAAEQLDESYFPRYVFKQSRSSTGTFEFRTKGNEKHKKGKSILKGIKEFKAHPEMYIAMTFQFNSKSWPTKEQEYYLIERKGTQQLAATGSDDTGWMAVLLNEYQHLPPFPNNNEFPMKFRDKYTDAMTHKGTLLHSDQFRPVCPGRGMGCADTPLLKVIGNIDPSDIHQGQVRIESSSTACLR
jgi:hypothetical protein